MRKLVIFVIALLLSLPSMADTQIIELRHRTAAELLPVIQPFLEPHERASDWGFQLIIQAEPNKIDEIRQLLEQMDKPARRLLISVDSNDSGISHDSQTALHGRLSTRGSDGRINIKRQSTRTSDSGIRSIQTLEGSAALIQSGQQIHENNWSRDRHGRPYQSTNQRNLVQGFYVVATVHGDSVTLELSNENDRLDGQNRQITRSQSTSTRISGPLNQWIQVGAIHSTENSEQSDILAKSRNYSTDNNNLRIKVELLD